MTIDEIKERLKRDKRYSKLLETNPTAKVEAVDRGTYYSVMISGTNFMAVACVEKQPFTVQDGQA